MSDDFAARTSSTPRGETSSPRRFDRAALSPWEIVLADEAATQGDIATAYNTLRSLARRDGRLHCGSRVGYLRHVDRGEEVCLWCSIHDLVRTKVHERAATRRRARQRSPRRVEQLRSREELARLWREENGRA